MNIKIVGAGVIGVIAIVGVVSMLHSRGIASTMTAALTEAQTTNNQSPISASSTASLMQSTGALFSQYRYVSKAYEIFPTLGTSTVKMMGAFGYTKEVLGNNMYRITLTNNAGGYQGESVIVSGDQSVYFIELARRDDSISGDAFPKDDTLIAVDAQGYILQ